MQSGSPSTWLCCCQVGTGGTRAYNLGFPLPVNVAKCCCQVGARTKGSDLSEKSVW